MHPDSFLNTEEIKSDHPINMNDELVLKEKVEKLPQMRFLFNNQEILDHTIQIILCAIKLANNGSTEKEKMRASFKQILEDFLGVVNYNQMHRQSLEINQLQEA